MFVYALTTFTGAFLLFLVPPLVGKHILPWPGGAPAVQLAERACALTRYREAIMAGTLAAAYAEAGCCDDAITTAQKARTAALARGQTVIAARNEQLLEWY